MALRLARAQDSHERKRALPDATIEIIDEILPLHFILLLDIACVARFFLRSKGWCAVCSTYSPTGSPSAPAGCGVVSRAVAGVTLGGRPGTDAEGASARGTSGGVCLDGARAGRGKIRVRLAGTGN